MKLALFDLDHTLLPLDSDHSWGQFTVRLGWCEKVGFAQKNDAFYEQYRAQTLNVSEYVRFATQAVRERGMAAAQAAHAQFMQEVIRPAITAEAKALLQAHRAAGDTLIVVTATHEFVTAPIVRELGVDELIAVRLQRNAAGEYTGEIEGTPSFREGKVERVAQWLAERGHRRSDVHITFYSDSINDAPLLEYADVPVATNPDERLRSLAVQRGWRILDLWTS